MALPRYQNIGVSAGAGISGIDFPNRGEATRGFDTLSSALNTMSEAFFGEAAIAATEEGKAYGAEKAPTQEQIRRSIETGTPIEPVGDARTFFGKAARATSAQIAAIGVEAQAKLDLGKIEAGIKAGTIRANDVIPQVNALTQGYSTALRQFDPVMAGKLSAELAKDGNTLFLAASARAAAEAAATAKRDIEASADAKLKLIPYVIEGGDVAFVDRDTGNSINRSITDRIEVERKIFEQTISKLPAREQEAYRNAWDKNAALGVQMYVADSIRRGDVTDAKRRLEAKEFDPLLEKNPLLRSSLLEKIDTYEANVKREEAAALRVEAAKFKDLATNTRAALLDGRTDVDLSWYSKERSAKLLGPEAERVDRDMAAAVQFNIARSKVALMSPQEEAEARAEFGRAVPAGGEGYVQRRDEAAAFDRAIAAKRQALASDPATYVIQASPQVRQAYNDMTSSATESLEAQKAAASRYIAASLDMQRYLGIGEPDLKAVPESTVNRIVSTINTETNSGQTIADAIRREAIVWGDYWPMVERQLVAEKVPQEVGVVANLVTRGNFEVAQELSLALQSGAKKEIDTFVSTIPDAKKDITASVIKNMESLNKSLQNVGGGPDQFNAYSTAVQTLAKRYMFNKGVPAKDAAAQAYKDIISSTYDFVSVGNDTIRIPKREKGVVSPAIERGPTAGTGAGTGSIFGADDLVRGLLYIRGNIENYNITPFPSLDKGITREEAQRQTFESLRVSGRFVTNATETGVSLYDATGKIVRDVNGKDVDFTWAQLVEFGAAPRKARERR